MDEENNLFHYNDKILEIPIGSYEIEDIESYLQKTLGKDNISVKPNLNTLLCEIHSKFSVDFTKPRTIGRMLGFGPSRILEPNKAHQSELPVDIIRLDTINIDCNIASGAYFNEREVHTIYGFSNVTPVGYKIIEKQEPPIYYPVLDKFIDNITVTVTDQEGRLVNFRGELLTVRVHLKEDGY